jgi:hypothetical protein
MIPSWAGRLRGDAALASIVFAIAAVVAALVIRPTHLGPVGSDTAATVLYFDRIAAREHLELFLGTTPKPFLTLVYGGLFALVHDWRAISWLAIVVEAVGIATAAVLARRESRSIVGAIFVATGLLVSAGLLRDASLAYSVSWCLACWSIAGLAVTSDPPRYGLAGVALLIGGSIRPETLFIVGLAGVALAARALATRGGEGGPPRRAWLVLLGLGAIPVSAVHDLLLTGDPLYALRVPGLGTGIRPDQTTAAALGIVGAHLGALGPLAALAIVGSLVLIARRRWAVLLGLVAIGPGVLALLLLLALRGVYVLDRYALPIDLAVIFAAGIGLTGLAIPTLASLDHLDRLGPWAGSALRVGLAIFVALAASPAVGPIDRTLADQIRADRLTVGNLESALPSLTRALDAIPGARDRPGRSEPTATRGTRPAILLVPARVFPMAAVELGLPIDRVVRSEPARIQPDGTWPTVGQLVVPDGTVDLPAAGLTFLEVDHATAVDGMTIVPLLSDPARRLWVLSIEPR